MQDPPMQDPPMNNGQPDHQTKRQSSNQRQQSGQSTAPGISRPQLYKRVISIKFGGSDFYVILAQKRGNASSAKSRFVIIREFKRPDSNHLHFNIPIRHLGHRHLVGIENCLQSATVTSVVYEYLPVSLSELSRMPNLSDVDLSTVFTQVGAPSYVHDH